MITIELLKNLTPQPFKDHNKKPYNIADRVKENVNDVKFFGKPEDVIYHEGYLGYLSKAWANHYSVVLKPDDIWYMVLGELTQAIAKDPETYSGLFTKTPGEKKLIAVPTTSVEEIDPSLVIDLLKTKVPSKVDDFLPKFSTATLMSTLAMNVAFCDLVSPYYSYGTFLCGIPSIQVDGTKEDWGLVKVKLNVIRELFSGSLRTYLDRCYGVVEDITREMDSSSAREYFNKMVNLQPCGSGSQQEMSGWIMRLFNKKNFDRPTQLEGLPPHMAKMDYTNLDTNRTFSLYCGLFYSYIENGFLLPNYDAFRVETTDGMNKKEKTSVTELGMEFVSIPVVSEFKPGIVYAPYVPRIK
jgi:hypothetical protein